LNRGIVGSAPLSVDELIWMLEGLSPAVTGVPLDGLGHDVWQRLADVARDGQRALDNLIVRIGVVVDRQAELEGDRSRRAEEVLLGSRAKVRARTARRDAKRSQVAGAMDLVGQAVDQGRLSGEALDSLANRTSDLSPAQRLRLNTHEMVEAAATMPGDLFDRRLRDAVIEAKGDGGLSDTKARQAASSLKHWVDETSGMGRLSAHLDPERYEAVICAIEARVSSLANQGGVEKSSQLAADAMVQLVSGPGGASRPAHINVVVDAQTMATGLHPATMAETAGGHSLPPESVSRLACNAVLQRVLLDKAGVPVDVGRGYRTATSPQWKAIKTVYVTCAWSGCDAPISWCQLHHIHEWEHGGPTDLCNLIPLCGRHHHAVHEGGWSVRLAPERVLEIRNPQGELHATAKPDRFSRNHPQRE
jgi:hypothetical protein